MVPISEYILLFIVLCYVWYLFQIKIDYIFPFLIVGIIYAYAHHSEQNNNILKEEDISAMYKTLSLVETIPIQVAQHINNDVIQYKRYNPKIYDNFIAKLNKYYISSDKDNEELKVLIHTYRELSYAMPVNESFNHYESLCKLCLLLGYEDKLEPVGSILNNYE